MDAEPKPERPGAPTLALTVRPFGETREWEEELRASEIRKALILDSALDCILTADHEGRIIEFNAAARRLFGYSRSEVLGREVADTIVPPALRDEHAAAAARVRRDRRQPRPRPPPRGDRDARRTARWSRSRWWWCPPTSRAA